MCAQLTAAAQSLSQPLPSPSTKGRERALQSRAQSSQVGDRGTRAWSSPLSDRPPQRGKNCPLCHSRMPFNARLRFFTCSDHMSRGEQAHLPRNHSRGSRETVPSQEGNPPSEPRRQLIPGHLRTEEPPVLRRSVQLQTHQRQHKQAHSLGET